MQTFRKRRAGLSAAAGLSCLFTGSGCYEPFALAQQRSTALPWPLAVTPATMFYPTVLRVFTVMSCRAAMFLHPCCRFQLSAVVYFWLEAIRSHMHWVIFVNQQHIWCTRGQWATSLFDLAFCCAFRWAKVRSKTRLKSKSEVILLSLSLSPNFGLRPKFWLSERLSSLASHWTQLWWCTGMSLKSYVVAAVTLMHCDTYNHCWHSMSPRW